MPTARQLLAAALLSASLANPVLAASAQSTPPDAVTASEFSAYKELSQTRQDANKESLQKDIAAVGVRLDNQDKRLGDVGFGVSAISNQLATAGIVLAVISVALVILGAFCAVLGKKAVINLLGEELHKLFNNEAQGYIDKGLADMEMKLGEMNAAYTKAIDETQQRYVTKFQAQLGAMQAQFEEAIKAAQSQMEDRIKTLISPMVEDAIRPLQEKMDRLAPGAQMLAIGVPTTEDLTTEENAAKKASAEGNAALNIFEALLRQKDEKDYSYEDWNKLAFAAFSEGKFEDAIKCWGRATELPGVASKHIAQALLNKGVALGQLKRYDEALAAYAQLIERYGEDPSPALREQVAKALNDKGFALLCRAKQNWADEADRVADLAEAIKHLDQVPVDTSEFPYATGYRGYCSYLQDTSREGTRNFLTQALKGGWETLYQSTRNALEIHPVEPDKDFRTLLDAVWAEVQGQTPPDAAPLVSPQSPPLQGGGGGAADDEGYGA